MAYDFSKITERLYCGAHVSSDSDVNDIKLAGITHVIDCETDNETGLFLPNSGLALLSDPTDDDGQIKPSNWFSVGVDFAAAALVHPSFKVLTHCAAGVNRGPSMAYAILRALIGMEGQDALSLLRHGRPQIQARYWSDADNALKQLGWL